MLPIEVTADEALQDAGAGVIEGNEVGAGAYDLSFAGSDRQVMWRVRTDCCGRALSARARQPCLRLGEEVHGVMRMVVVSGTEPRGQSWPTFTAR